jgi:hypothetical protein
MGKTKYVLKILVQKGHLEDGVKRECYGIQIYRFCTAVWIYVIWVGSIMLFCSYDEQHSYSVI